MHLINQICLFHQILKYLNLCFQTISITIQLDDILLFYKQFLSKVFFEPLLWLNMAIQSMLLVHDQLIQCGFDPCEPRSLYSQASVRIHGFTSTLANNVLWITYTHLITCTSCSSVCTNSDTKWKLILHLGEIYSFQLVTMLASVVKKRISQNFFMQQWSYRTNNLNSNILLSITLNVDLLQ